MAARRQIARQESKATEVGGILFFNESAHPKSSMRQAAKRFAQSEEFSSDCRYYDAHSVGGRWKFTPVGRK